MNTEIFSQINWIAVLTGAIGYFLLGALWYSKVLFVKKWIAYTGVSMSDPNAKKGVAGIMFLSFILMFVCSFGLAFLSAKFNMHGWTLGLKLGLLTGICFAATAVSITYVYEKKPLGLHLINGGYNVIGNIIAAMIICCWK